MEINEINVENMSFYVDQFKYNLSVFQRDYKEVEKEVIKYETEMEGVKKRTDDVIQRARAVGSVVKMSDNMPDVVQLNKFTGVVRKTVEIMEEMKIRIAALRRTQTSGDIAEEARVNIKPLTSHLSIQVLNSRQTKEPFILLIMKTEQKINCNTCKKPIFLYSEYLSHLEQYPLGSNKMWEHYYHIKIQCFIVRGFQLKYLNCAKIICEDINEAQVEVLQKIGFRPENMKNKDDSDSDSDEFEIMSQHSAASYEEANILNFVYRRKTNLLDEKVQCVACHRDIFSDSYLTHGNTLLKPFHITKGCIQSAEAGIIDFSQVKCRVFKLLRNHSDLRQLLSCGFYYTKIIGFRPQKPNPKGCIREVGDKALKIDHFFLKRNDGSINRNLICVECKKNISQNIYLIRGDKSEQSFHIKRNCVKLSELGSNISRVQCKVAKLLRDHSELRLLLGCGFHYNNIIGVRPSHKKIEINLEPALLKDTTAKDVGFIFNEEVFTYERLLFGEKCQGCTQFIKKEDFCFRHKERIPREKQLECLLISQFYHISKSCLLKRGFTEKFLEFALVKVVIKESEDLPKIKDIVVRCGFSSDNLSCNKLEDVPRQSFNSPIGFQKNIPQCYIFVVNCTKTTIRCEGCKFKIISNSTCFKYEAHILQDSPLILFHFEETCLRKYFDNDQMLSMTCINNNSLTDITLEDILKCGITKIDTKMPFSQRMNPRKGPKCNPLKLDKLKFIVDIVMDNQDLCSACKKPLQIDKYVLKTINNDGSSPIKMHLDASCVRKCGFLPSQLSECDLSLEVYISPNGRQRLQECGFRHIPYVS